MHLSIADFDLDPTGKWVCTLPLSAGKDWGEPLVVIICPEHSGGCECWNDIRKKKEPDFE